jgi:serine/threonine protein kinase/formylglycine-generating enzyme required for sulfatase activity
MPDTASHPTPEQLAAFSQGQLSPAATQTVARHLESCPRCQAAVRASADAFLSNLRDARPDPSGTCLAGPSPVRPASPAVPPPQAAVGVPPELAGHAKYRIVRELGRGGMGVVYQAVQALMDRPVAVKVIHPSVLAHADALPRFHAEVKAAARLDHPNIVRAHDAEQVGSLHLLVMEFVEGMNLAQVVERHGPLPVAEACRCIHQALLGLQHAFEQKMVHRDVKPQNLMRTAKGQIKILDFGLARLRGEGTKGSRGLTEAGSFMGTPEYVAPEQATDAHTADTRADVYSIGCTLYYLLTGRPPFVESTTVKLVLAHLKTIPRPLHELRADVPPELSAVVGRMLAKDPAQRYQTPLEAARALAPFCRSANHPAPGPPPSPGLSAPGQATVMQADTRAIRGPGAPSILQGETVLVPGAMPVPGQAAPAGSPFQNLADSSAPVVVRPKVGRRSRPPRPSAWRRRSVLAGAGGAIVALVLLAWWLTGGGSPKGSPKKQDGRPEALDCTRPEGVSAEGVRRAQAAWAKYLGRRVDETVDVDGVKMTFVLVPPGKFRMGSPEGEAGHVKDETLHEVTLTEPFDLGKTEVTQAQYEALGGESPSKFQNPLLPVERVSWEDAQDWAARLTKKREDRHVYRLPTEAEWEYSCRGGRPSSQAFGVGGGRELSSRKANFNGLFPFGDTDVGPNHQSPRPAGAYDANALGLRDMHGNVREWCADWWGEYPRGEAVNPAGPSGGSGDRVIRGGGWVSRGRDCRAAFRDRDKPRARYEDLGFRLARTLPPTGE